MDADAVLTGTQGSDEPPAAQAELPETYVFMSESE